jgi:hypothetical protein
MQVRLLVGGLIGQLGPFSYLVLDLLFGQDGRDVFHLKDQADFDFGIAGGVAVEGTFDLLDGLLKDLT